MNAHDPAKIETEPATLDKLDVAMQELTKAEEEEKAARDALREATVTWQNARKETAKKRETRNRVMRQLRAKGVTVLAAHTGMKHPQASRILADDQ
jgi:U3 small nucleolar ribonucleoprotein component